MSKQPAATGNASVQGKQTLMTTSNQHTSPPQEQFKSISGGATAEQNYANVIIEQIEEGNKVNGPSLMLDKNQLCMMSPVGITAQDQVKISNAGVTTITYDWKKVQRGDFIPSKNSDGVQRFYCHYPHGLLKPMESKTFTFSFRSADKPGMFFEEWELITDPQTYHKLPSFYLSGMATLNDDKRQGLIHDQLSKVEKEILENKEKQRKLDELDQIREPEAPKPDIRDVATFQKYFEEKNRHIGVYFSQSVMNQLFELLEDIIDRAPALQELAEGVEGIYDNWHASLEYVEGLIAHVNNPYTRQSLSDRYMKILSLSRKVPTDRAQSYGVFRTMLLNLSEQTIDLEQKARDELQTIANPGFIVPHDTITPEEIKKIEDERKAKKADWYKATKKKPKTDEEELQEAEEIKQKTIAGLKNELINNRLTKVGREIDILRTKWLMENHEKMDRKKYDDLYHLESVLDIDVAGKDIIVRLDLDVPLSNYVPLPAESQMGSHHDMDKSQGTKETKGGKTTKSGKGGKDENAPVKHKPDEPWKRREILNHALVKSAARELRYLQQERMANRIWVLGNLAERSGRVKPENSMRIIHNALQKTLSDQPLIFVDDAVIPDFESKKENEVFPEQSTFILENLNFKPDEYGYVEPEKIVEDPAVVKAREEELARQEEEKQKELLAAQQKGGKAAPAKPAPAAPVDKKKEEEMKKKADEEAALLAKKKAEEAALNNLSEEEKAELHRQKEEAERKKREAEYFDYRTIHKFKGNLGRYGELYVNDAPLATLSSSNSVAEIKCKRKVMGVKMTEELRKLCMFFLKKHPKDIGDLWYSKPSRKAYFNKEFSAVIGGSISGVQDILDKILLANALLDQTNEIYFAGQFGLAALVALGVKVGHLENHSDVEQTQEFFQTLFAKAVQKNARIHFPQDVLVANQSEIDHAKQEQAEYDHQQQQLILQHQQEQQRLQQQMNTGGSKQGNKGGKPATTTNGVHNTGGSGLAGLDSAINQSNNFGSGDAGKGPKSWTDRLISGGKGRDVKLTEKIAHHWNEIVKSVYNKYVEEGKINKDSDPGFNEHPLTRGAFMVNINREVMSRENGSHQQEDQSVLSGHQAPSQHTTSAEQEVKGDDIVIEYMSETRELLLQMLQQTFKLLWDGSLSPSHDPQAISPTNKQFVEALLDLRVTTQNDDEPPVTLLHGLETDSVVKQALLKIKVEQQEALEEQKRKAKEAKLAARLARQAAGEDDDEEEEEEEAEQKEETMTNNGDESMDQGHGHGEMGQIADFHVHEIPQFTTKVMQGVANKSLLAMHSHRRKGKQEISEELYLLDEI